LNEQQKAAMIREVDRFLALGRQLFPIKPGQKDPLEKKWNTIKYSRRALHSFVNRRGCNIGWRLSPDDLVIDVDPRHENALGSEERLTEKWETERLNELCPTVHTGGLDCGRHYYTRLPEAVKCKTVLAQFDGIDFIRHPLFVLIPGCIHPDTGRAYRWDFFCPQDAPIIPPWLFDMLWVNSTQNRPPQPKRERVDPTLTVGQRKPYSLPIKLSLPEIEGHLSHIPAEKHQNYQDWLRIGMAVHAACEGDPEGCELFVRWSISDPSYFDAEAAARAKWESFSTDHDNGVTAATLVQAAMLEGGSPCSLPPKLAFDTPVIAAPSLQTLPEFLRSLLRDSRPTLARAVAQAHRYGPENWDQIREQLKVIYDVRLSSVDQVKREFDKARLRKARERKRQKKKEEQIGERQVADPAIDVVKHLLESRFEKGRLLIHAKNQQFYAFKKTHWEPLPPNEIDQLIFDAAEEIQLNPENVLKFKSSTLFASAERVLIARTTRTDDVFAFQGPPPAVVNTTNFEVWMNEDGGYHPAPHKPESYLLSCLNTEFDPAAKCPVFDRTLQEIFQNNDDSAGMIRHLFEFFGYTMQPFKNIPTWWMFQGEGSNGKTFCFNVYRNLLGSAVLPRAINEFADVGRNNHSLYSLVGKLLIMDDDAKTNGFLPESALKKLSEMKLFEANPKRKDAFTFLSCATPVMLINDWPQVKDLSWGLIRKAYVLPFRRVFAPEEYDLKREPYVVKNELPGILNRSLAGYSRMRARGQLAEPIECSRAKDEWLMAASPLIEFSKTELQPSKDNTKIVPVNAIYQHYLNWCHNVGGVRFPVAKNRFEIALKQIGYRIGDGTDSEHEIIGAVMKGTAQDVFAK